MQSLGLNTSYVQRDNEHETGTAAVSIDPAGQPNFTIKELAAWDFLQWTAEWEDLSSRADVICFGSLAQRSPAIRSCRGIFSAKRTAEKPANI